MYIHRQRAGIVTNWDDMERLWRHVFLEELQARACICRCVCVCVYIYIYIERERERVTRRRPLFHGRIPCFGSPLLGAVKKFARGSHLSNTTCLTHDFFKRLPRRAAGAPPFASESTEAPIIPETNPNSDDNDRGFGQGERWSL